MALQLSNLRKLAILKGVEITYKEKSSGRAWRIARDGIIKFAVPKPWGEPVDHTPEQILETADEFSIWAEGHPQVFNRKEMEDFLADALKSPHAAKAAADEQE